MGPPERGRADSPFEPSYGSGNVRLQEAAFPLLCSARGDGAGVEGVVRAPRLDIRIVRPAERRSWLDAHGEGKSPE